MAVVGSSFRDHKSLIGLGYRIGRAGLFRIGGGDPEAAHEWTLARLSFLTGQPWALGLLSRRYAVRAPVEVFGITFPNRVGLAAGMDKQGQALTAWPALGFGFVEVGTVTWHPQSGNPRPRAFRLRASEAIINRMGFNNAGAEALADTLRRVGPVGVPLGVSLGKSRVTPVAEATADYLESLRTLYPYGDYFAVNVSSPNTPGLRDLQDRDQLDELLTALVGEANARGGKPVLVKLAPDLSDHAIAQALNVCRERGVAGVIATNTTVGRGGVAPADVVRAEQAGGLSGRPLADRAREVVAFIHREAGEALPVIGVGGVMDPDDAERLVDAGARLVQLYTGFIYGGPRLVRETARLLAAMEDDK
jgi:dihydroorotate dehydrogenase